MIVMMIAITPSLNASIRPVPMSGSISRPRRPSRSLHGDEHRRVFILEQDHHELGWLRLARVTPDGMDVLGSLVERLPRGERHGLATLDTHLDGALEHVDQRVRVVRVDRFGRGPR